MPRLMKSQHIIIDKGEWIDSERLRWATLFHVPMAKSLPPGFPANTIKVGSQTPFKLKLISRRLRGF